MYFKCDCNDDTITIDSRFSDILIDIYHIKMIYINKEKLIKIHLFDSANIAEIVYRDNEKILVRVDTKPETIFLITKKYIIEVREDLIQIYLLNDEFNIEKLNIDIDAEYDDFYDTYFFYLKITE